VAEDLGTWAPEQATVLLEALQQAGLSPEAKRSREGILVTVPDEEADEAHRTLVANMDAIARAARSPVGSRGRRQRPARTERSSDGGEERKLTTQRLTGFARPLALVLLGSLIAAAVPALRLPVIVATIAAVVYLVGKQAQREQDDL
jgi:hypothetical protein